MTRLPRGSMLLAALLASATLPAPAWSGCDLDHGQAGAHDGLQVQVDPKTGAYSMPAPGTLPADAATVGARDRGAVIVPGTTAAGGYTIKAAPSADAEAAPSTGEGK